MAIRPLQPKINEEDIDLALLYEHTMTYSMPEAMIRCLIDCGSLTPGLAAAADLVALEVMGKLQDDKEFIRLYMLGFDPQERKLLLAEAGLPEGFFNQRQPKKGKAKITPKKKETPEWH